MIQTIFIAVILLLSTSRAKIMRNNALMTKMVSNFRQNEYSEETDESQPVLIRMQNVLCKNFPTIPCNMILKDKTLKKLIEKSIQQINYKKLSFEKTTPFPGYLTLFPILNDISANHEKYKKTKTEKRKKINNKKRTSVYNRKKLRKFYPHKVKYRDKNHLKEDFDEHSGEKLSMSVEIPDMTLTKKHQHFSYKMEPVDPPVWRIDYTKHDEPNQNMFDNRFNYMKTGPNVVVDNINRKEVFHPDVYIKKNYVRKNLDLQSDGID